MMETCLKAPIHVRRTNIVELLCYELGLDLAALTSQSYFIFLSNKPLGQTTYSLCTHPFELGMSFLFSLRN